MLNLFPSLLTFRLLAPTILRIALGLLFVYVGWHKVKTPKEVWESAMKERGVKMGFGGLKVIAALELLSGVALLLGLYTQVAAIVVIVLAIGFSILKAKGQNPGGYPVHVNLILIAIAVSLLVTGAGAFAFDLPL